MTKQVSDAISLAWSGITYNDLKQNIKKYAEVENQDLWGKKRDFPTITESMGPKSVIIDS